MIEVIKQILPMLKISINQEEQLKKYFNFLVDQNKLINLTTIIDQKEVYLKHFVDSLLIFKEHQLFTNEKIIDVGSGAGFPGIVLKIFCPEIKLTIVEALQKRCLFLNNLLNILKIRDVNIIHGRAEIIARSFSDEFDIAVSRAVAKLSVLLELLVRFVKVDGKIICYKGSQIKEELQQTSILQEKMFLSFDKKYYFNIPNIGERNILIFKKNKNTPEKYPRPFSQIKKEHY